MKEKCAFPVHEQLEELVRLYADALVRYAFGYLGSADLAEEAMEDAFALLLVKSPSFASRQQAKVWLYKVTRSRAVDYLRRHRREIALAEVEGVLADPGQDLEKALQRRLLYTSMLKLPKQYREVLMLSYFDGFTVSEICKLTKKREKQVYNLLSRAKANLRQILLEEGFSYEEF